MVASASVWAPPVSEVALRGTGERLGEEDGEVERRWEADAERDLCMEGMLGWGVPVGCHAGEAEGGKTTAPPLVAGEVVRRWEADAVRDLCMDGMLGWGVPEGCHAGVAEGGETTAPSRLNPRGLEAAVQLPAVNLNLHGSMHGRAWRNTDQVHDNAPLFAFHLIALVAPEMTRA